MAEAKPTSSTNPVGYQPATPYKPKVPNPALRMLGLSKLKLPSRNWMIFLAITGSFSAAIIYDRREKDRATLKWAKSVAHLAKEPISNPSQLPRKLTIYLESPPGDGLRAAQDHFRAYVKPILAASGLDWDFVQGRKEGDIRAAVAERIRRARRAEDGIEQAPTEEDVINEHRKRNKIPEYEGTLGDIVIGRHTWKEYVRGLHEGWLGPLEAPLKPGSETPTDEPDKKAEDDENKHAEEEKKPKRPPQPPPYNSPDDYPISTLPALVPGEFQPAAVVQFPHLLGFLNTPTRTWRYMHRRRVADDIGRQVAAACLCTARDFRESGSEYELQSELQKEEKDWVKSVWKEDEKKKKDDASLVNSDEEKEKVWTRPVVVDPRIAMRMRRFEVDAEAEERARQVVVKEEEIEGFIKGSMRKLWRWGFSQFEKKDEGPWVES